MNKIRKIPHDVLYGRYCSMCDECEVQHPPKNITNKELIKTIITTPTLQGGKLKTLLNDGVAMEYIKSIQNKKGGSALVKKEYPQNYQKATQNLIRIISFNPKNIKVQGTMSYRAYRYPSDYDLFETVQVSKLSDIVKVFQSKIKLLLSLNDVYIGDIKAGEYEPLRLINERAYFKNNKVIGYDYNDTMSRLNKIFEDGFINKKEHSKLKAMIKKKPTKEQWNIMVKNLRLHVLRWTPEDILKGYKEFNKHKFTLEEALKTNGLFKLDVIAYINNKFSEFSIIYDLRHDRKRLNNFKININEDLKANINQLQDNSQYFKMLKRILSLMRVKMKNLKNDDDKAILSKEIEDITDILNGELGILNSVANDIDIILQILANEKNTPTTTIKEQIDNFIHRLSSIYKTQQYLKNEKSILKGIQKALEAKTQTKLEKELNQVKDKLLQILNHNAKKSAMKYMNMF